MSDTRVADEERGGNEANNTIAVAIVDDTSALSRITSGFNGIWCATATTGGAGGLFGFFGEDNDVDDKLNQHRQQPAPPALVLSRSNESSSQESRLSGNFNDRKGTDIRKILDTVRAGTGRSPPNSNDGRAVGSLISDGMLSFTPTPPLDVVDESTHSIMAPSPAFAVDDIDVKYLPDRSSPSIFINDEEQSQAPSVVDAGDNIDVKYLPGRSSLSIFINDEEQSQAPSGRSSPSIFINDEEQSQAPSVVDAGDNNRRKKKKRRIIAGAIIFSVSVASILAVGVALQQTLFSNNGATTTQSSGMIASAEEQEVDTTTTSTNIEDGAESETASEVVSTSVPASEEDDSGPSDASNQSVSVNSSISVNDEGSSSTNDESVTVSSSSSATAEGTTGDESQQAVQTETSSIYSSSSILTSPPTPKPSRSPTHEPTSPPTPEPTSPPTSEPTVEPTPLPTKQPVTGKPSSKPTSPPIPEMVVALVFMTPSPTEPPTPNPTPLPISSPPTPLPTPQPTSPPTEFPSYLPTRIPTDPPFTEYPTSKPTWRFSASEPNGNPRLTIELQMDWYAHETTWSLHSINAATNAEIEQIASVGRHTYQAQELDTIDLYLSPGKYRFTLKDFGGDGFCCSNGEGEYVITLEGREIIRGEVFNDQVSYDIMVGYDPDLSDRESKWLTAHNDRRKTWHQQNGEKYAKLHWSEELALDALSRAQELLDDCNIAGVSNEFKGPEGENIYKNKANSVGSVGNFYPPDTILRNWVDNKANVGYPQNEELTQALWRASRYVGCADAFKNYNNGAICRVSVCRYVRRGNCAMSQFTDWLEPMLMERTRCGPDCPQEGCF